MAFGQGAGVMLATPEALAAAYTACQSAINEKAGQWPEIELRTIEFARAVGFVSAVTAAQKGHGVIDVDDVKAAFTSVRRNRLRPLELCSLTPLKKRLEV
jgi:hypothetical protein